MCEASCWKNVFVPVNVAEALRLSGAAGKCGHAECGQAAERARVADIRRRQADANAEPDSDALTLGDAGSGDASERARRADLRRRISESKAR
jgi:hypothetical protein